VKTLVEIDFETMQHGWMWSLIPKLKDIGIPFVDGLGGDTLSNGLFFSLKFNRMMRNGDYRDLTKLLAQRVMKRASAALAHDEAELDRLNDILLAELEKWQHWPNPYMAFTFFTRTRRSIAVAPLTIGRVTGLPPLFPYLEKSVFKFLMGLDEMFFQNKGFHDEAIALRYPQYSKVPYGVPRGLGHLGYRKSLKNILPYLLAFKLERIAKRAGLREALGIIKVLLGADFARESPRFEDIEFALALDLARKHRVDYGSILGGGY
jgi:hypothetical protein